MRRKPALTEHSTIPSGQRMPRDKIGDRKGFYPEPSKPTHQHSVNVVAQCLRQGRQGVSFTNWDMFGAYGNAGREVGKRKMRIQNSPVPHTREYVGVHFDKRSGKLSRKGRYKTFSVT